jgi:TRAP-type C4-dicarboxylate transport system permease small subunit
MNAQKIVAIVLIVGGALGLGYRGFSYTRETHNADIGSLHLSVDETKRVNVPVWVGIAAVVVGGLMLTMGRKQ